MSHWFSVKTRFQNERAIKQAANSLGFSVVHRKSCRGYGGQTKVCDLVLKLPGEYDVGFMRWDDAFVVVADFWLDEIAKYLADPQTLAKAKEGYDQICKMQGFGQAEQSLADAKLSKFTQTYNRFAVKELIHAKGLQYMETALSDGTVVLEVNGNPY